MMRAIIVLLLLCMPMMSFAQRVTVRSGEHADFSRLAFEFSKPVEWEMGRVDQGYEIRLQGVDEEIDISNVFSRIPRNRIKSLSVLDNNTRIVLVLGCECHADAFEFRPGLLVIDVKDGQPLATSRFEAAFVSDELIADQYESPTDSEVVVTTTTEITKEDPGMTLPLSLPKVSAANNQSAVLFGENSEGGMQEPAQQVSEMQSEILHQIGRAASQGLLEANLTHSWKAEPSEGGVDHEMRLAPEVPIPKPHINIHIENSIDREFEGSTYQNLMTGNGLECLPERLFNISEWGNEEAILTSISEQRRLIFGEFDKVDAHAVRELSKAYIYAGFGVEALSVLSAFDVMLDDEKTLKVMAKIIDGITPDRQSDLADQVGCDTASALWAALSVPTLSNQTSINTVSILGAFTGLPIHLRRQLGPKLANKFLDIGDLVTARTIRNAIARAPGDAGPEFHLLDAQLDFERGKINAAEHKLEDIVDNGNEVAPRALIKLFEVRLHNNEAIDSQIMSTAESYIFEQRDSKIAADLKRMIALSYGQSGDFINALETLTQMGEFEQIDKQQEAITWGLVVENLTMKASESSLLQFVYSAQEDLVNQNISRLVRRKLAVRLLNEGWPRMAEMVLAAPVTPTADDRIILARVGYLTGNSENILTRLENIAGEEASIIRALAYEDLGRFSDAAQEYKMLNNEGSQRAASWRAKDWAQLAVAGSKNDRAAAEIMLMSHQAEEEIRPIKNSVFSHNSSLLMKSEDERQTLEILLKEYPVLEQEGF